MPDLPCVVVVSQRWPVSHWDEVLPPLDCHAHLAPDITSEQVANLKGAEVFGVSRSLAEASAAIAIGHPAVTWGCGVHPSDAAALAAFSATTFAGLLSRVALVGEVGLDGRAGNSERQRRVFEEMLGLSMGQPVLLSIHSAGAVSDVVDMLERQPHPGAILHWFLGDQTAMRRAMSMGACFSVNGAMSDQRLKSLPRDRVLSETDFPSAGRRAGNRPGDTAALEARLAALWGVSVHAVRRQFYRNLRNLASRTGAIERLPETLADMLLFA